MTSELDKCSPLSPNRFICFSYTAQWYVHGNSLRASVSSKSFRLFSCFVNNPGFIFFAISLICEQL